MAKKCTICEKSYNVAWRIKKLRGKYNPTIKRKQLSNLQWVKLPTGKRIIACAKCIKALGKKRK